MDLFYKNETLYVTVFHDVTLDTIAQLKRRIFGIIEDYGIDKIILSIEGAYDKELINQFKREYYHAYKGFLLIK